MTEILFLVIFIQVEKLIKDFWKSYPIPTLLNLEETLSFIPTKKKVHSNIPIQLSKSKWNYITFHKKGTRGHSLLPYISHIFSRVFSKVKYLQERRSAYDRCVAETHQVEQAWSELSELLTQLHHKMEYAANTIRCASHWQRCLI